MTQRAATGIVFLVAFTVGLYTLKFHPHRKSCLISYVTRVGDTTENIRNIEETRVRFSDLQIIFASFFVFIFSSACSTISCSFVALFDRFFEEMSSSWPSNRVVFHDTFAWCTDTQMKIRSIR
jgi:hypothetical protein